jgi:hypothetical protein
VDVDASEKTGDNPMAASNNDGEDALDMDDVLDEDYVDLEHDEANDGDSESSEEEGDAYDDLDDEDEAEEGRLGDPLAMEVDVPDERRATGDELNALEAAAATDDNFMAKLGANQLRYQRDIMSIIQQQVRRRSTSNTKLNPATGIEYAAKHQAPRRRRYTRHRRS